MVLACTLLAHQKGKEERDRERETLEREGGRIEIHPEQVQVGAEKDEDPVITANQKETHKAKY